MNENSINRSSANWSLMIKEDNREAIKVLAAYKERIKGKKFEVVRVDGIRPTWIEREIK